MPISKLSLKSYHLEKIRETHNIINKNPFQSRTIDELAITVNTNRKVLILGFKQLYGMGINEYQVKLRVEKARELLETTDKPIKQIAKATGFITGNGLRKAFLKNFGVSPSAWRKISGELTGTKD